jgi:hypothetical protein
MKSKSQAEWKVILREQEGSGQSASVYCRAKGINVKTFSNQKRKCYQSTNASGFLPVVIQSSKSTSHQQSCMTQPCLILKHRNITLDFVELPASEWLAQLLVNASI